MAIEHCGIPLTADAIKTKLLDMELVVRLRVIRRTGMLIFNKAGILVATACLLNGVYKLNMSEHCLTAAMTVSSEVWHRRLGHVNSQYLNKMQDAVEGLTIDSKIDISKSSCVACCEGKQSRLPFPKEGSRKFCNSKFDDFLMSHGIVHHKTNPYTPEQNGLSERYNRTIVEKAKCLLFDAGLEKRFWAEAAHTAVYLQNRTVTTSLNYRTPFEIWTGRKPDEVSHEQSESLSLDDSGEIYVPCENETLDSSESGTTDSEDSIIFNNVNVISGPRRRQQPDRFGFASACIEDDQMFTGEILLQEALEGPEKAQWLEAVQEELQSFEKIVRGNL
ncbi:Retrovirus-related Pol polyprotein from transposon TNT 1-94 [Eumeta japonica]|uniref:Retrovirus-related Pol polyprotein from transposon TNT 1-94 n=1 Tax=Eumeta variegata TaxID=151549 RepID=A0A4C1YKC9_EUMVA|nr:Retrovirus-related Pol polyprotein from transposon TNT 1-94 [Eumeta japonica]